MNNKLSPTILILILSMMALLQMSVDLYTPSFPAIVEGLNCQLNQVQLSLSLFMLGFSCAHPFYGPWSDKIGRKTPVLTGITICTISAIFCALSSNITVLIISRFIQGFGIGCINSVGRSIARDLLSAEKLAKVGALIGMVSVIFLALSPTLGGYIQTHFGWQANFWLIAGFGCILVLAICLLLPETCQNPNQQATELSVMKKNYLILLTSPVFVGYTLCASFAGAGIIAYLAIAPFLFQNILGLSPIEYGWLAFVLSGGIFISGILNQLFIDKVGIQKMVLFGAITMLWAGLFLLACALVKINSITILMLGVGLYSLGAGLTFVNAFAGAFTPFANIAGTTGALYAFLQDLIAAIVSAVIALININNAVSLALVLTALASFAYAAYIYLLKKT